MGKRTGGDGGYVFSTQFGELCGTCERPLTECRCGRVGGPPSDGVVRVGRETKGRKGKGVTTVSGLPLAGAELKAFAKELKRACGTGGALKDGVLEIQGEHRDRIVALVEGRGWTVKRSGH